MRADELGWGKFESKESRSRLGRLHNGGSGGNGNSPMSCENWNGIDPRPQCRFR
jgi:hypothetical protein